jgi:alpha-1,2-mannosyltransferase
MKVGIIHGNFESLGGSETVFMFLVNLFKKKKFDVNIYFTDNVDEKKIQTVFGTSLEGVCIHKVRQIKIRFMGIYRYLINRIILTRAANDNDVVIETSGSLTPIWLTKRPYVVYCNGINQNANESYLVLQENIKKQNNLFLKIYYFIYFKILEHIKKNSDNILILSNSKYTQTLMNDIYSLKSEILYPFIKPDNFNFNQDHKEKNVIMLGRFSPEKNYEFALSLAEILPNINFILIGTVSSITYYEKIINMIKNKGISNNVTVLPNMSFKELKEKLSLAKVYLHCRFDEPFGMSVIESMAYGCIPIVPDSGGMKEVVPFDELRFSNIQEADEKIKSALDGKYDYLLPQINNHLEKFHHKVFEDKIIDTIKTIQGKKIR